MMTVSRWWYIAAAIGSKHETRVAIGRYRQWCAPRGRDNGGVGGGGGGATWSDDGRSPTLQSPRHRCAHDLRPHTMCIRARCVYDPSTTTQCPRRTPPVTRTINRPLRRRSPLFVALN